MWLSRSALPRRCGKAALFVATGVALNLLGGPSCSSSEAGLAVDVQLVSPRAGSAPIVSDRGYTVSVERGYLAVGSAELEGCATARRPSFDLPWGPSVAFAHTMSSPTRIGSPSVLSLVDQESAEQPFGSLGPPPGEYCSLRVGLEPADADAAGLPSDVDLVGVTLWLEGTYRDSSGTEKAFSVASAKALEESVPFDELELGDDAEQEVTLAVSIPTSHWFDGIDLATTDDEQIADLVLDNVRASLEVSVR
jgi:hypothetical protein